jgi:hypothetical protein
VGGISRLNVLGIHAGIAGVLRPLRAPPDGSDVGEVIRWYRMRVEPKILSDRVGRSNMNVTFQVYAHRFTGHDRMAADLIGGLIRDALEGGQAPSETA